MNAWKDFEHKVGAEYQTDLAETAACMGESNQSVAIPGVETLETKRAPDHH